MTCKDCVHNEVCGTKRFKEVNENAYPKIQYKCDHFKPKSRFVELKQGKWIHTDKADHWFGNDECSECQYHAFGRIDLSHFNY